MPKLTGPQLHTLRAIAIKLQDRASLHGKHEGFNIRVLERLRAAGLIHSAGPFAWAFHTTTLTDAGRVALQDAE